MARTVCGGIERGRAAFLSGLIGSFLRGITLVMGVSAVSGADAIGTADAIGSADARYGLQVTHSADNHILTNIGVWSADGKWIYYDVRSDLAGSVFDGTRIERVAWRTGEVETVYTARDGAHCGVVTCSPVDDRAVFIHGPEHPTPDWSYTFWHRRGVIVSGNRADSAVNLDACDIVPPYTPGALRGGSHVHVFSGDGQWVSFTYEDHVLATHGVTASPSEAEASSSDANQKSTHRDSTTAAPSAVSKNQRNVGVSVPIRAVEVSPSHPRNHRGSMFSVVVTHSTDEPRPGSDEFDRADSDAWIGVQGYRRADGSHQKRALAFLGNVIAEDGTRLVELFLVNVPEDVTQEGAGPLTGTPTTRPLPPAGTVQRRLTYTSHRRYPGLQGVRHWPRSSPDGKYIAFLMKDDQGVTQLWTISPNGGEPQQLTHNPYSVESAFSWSPDGRWVAFVGNQQVCIAARETGYTTPLTSPPPDGQPLRAEACVFSPNGQQIAFVRTMPHAMGPRNQVFVVEVPQ